MSDILFGSRENARGIFKGYALLLLPLAWWTFSLGTGLSTWCFLDYINLAFHEAGHIFLGFAGKTLHYLGGTLGQLLVPAALAAWFLLREEQPFAAALCCWWLGESLVNVSIYMADARSLQLPLVGGGDHDWNELFYRFGMLSEGAVNTTAGITHLLGAAVMLIGLAWSLLFILPQDRIEIVAGTLVSRWPWLARALPFTAGGFAGSHAQMARRP
jgi:hypothetical protein